MIAARLEELPGIWERQAQEYSERDQALANTVRACARELRVALAQRLREQADSEREEPEV